MFVCIECGRLFEEPQYWEERHGLDTPPYESLSGCPYCGGVYVKTFPCDCCGEYITGRYVQIDNKRYCENCYMFCDVTDEDVL